MGILISVINALFAVFYVLLFARIILSWVRPDPYHPIWGQVLNIVYGTTEPILGPIRRFMPNMGGLDLSPLIIFLLARVLQGLIIGLLV